mmetsp:Transcript_21969/g.62564  ORF Transcript_21969/g.62564 Transcript_21969/m.62564 type:complete len:200 (-) Transcript_21969:3231-3830(-)
MRFAAMKAPMPEGCMTSHASRDWARSSGERASAVRLLVRVWCSLSASPRGPPRSITSFSNTSVGGSGVNASLSARHDTTSAIGNAGGACTRRSLAAKRSITSLNISSSFSFCGMCSSLPCLANSVSMGSGSALGPVGQHDGSPIRTRRLTLNIESSSTACPICKEVCRTLVFRRDGFYMLFVFMVEWEVDEHKCGAIGN